MSAGTAARRFRRREREISTGAGCDLVITHPAAPGEFDDETGVWDGPTGEELHYTGRGIVRPLTRSGSDDLDAAGQEIVKGRYEVKVFDLDTVFHLGDQVLVAAADLDRGLVDKTLTVTDIPQDAWAVNRRLICTDDLAGVGL